MVIAALSAGAALTFCVGPDVTMAGLIGHEIVVAPVPTTNCCRTPVETFVSGCTRNTPAMVKTSPAAGALAPVSTASVAPACAAPLTRQAPLGALRGCDGGSGLPDQAK